MALEKVHKHTSAHPLTEPRVVLVVGTSGSGKTSLIRRFADGDFLENPEPTVGIDTEAACVSIVAHQDGTMPVGLALELWEIGGREYREAPRGRPYDGLLLCYDCTDRTSFLRATHVLCHYRLDWHKARARSEGVAASRPAAPRDLSVVLLCGTKCDDAGTSSMVSAVEAEEMVHANNLQGVVLTSAKTGMGVARVFQELASAMFRAEGDHALRSHAAAEAAARPAADSWSLPEKVARMTSPRGLRPHEPPRGTREHPTLALPLVEPLDQTGTPCAPRTLEKCLLQGLLHRAVHVWVCNPRNGSLLLRRYAPTAPKHPGRWGPTCHGEVQCYGSEGDGHASELSRQAAERCTHEQIGMDVGALGELEHWFSCETRDGSCRELLDVYVVPVSDVRLPPIRLQPPEKVDWVHYGDVFGAEAAEADTIFSMASEYRLSMRRQLRAL